MAESKKPLSEEKCPRPQKLFRSEKDRVIAGVAGGLGEYFRADANLFRIIFVLLGLLGGLGIVVYLILWLFLPLASKSEQPETKTISNNVKDISSKTKTASQQVQPQGVSVTKILLSLIITLLGIVVVVIATISGLTNLFGFDSLLLFLIFVFFALIVFLVT
ncbi:MAG TPA: PspC domain-containing protein [Clostridia bacterium]|nr:PspC domain-containing protein [Clostridia bacterium]